MLSQQTETAARFQTLSCNVILGDKSIGDLIRINRVQTRGQTAIRQD